jgi:hypothetical protein
MNRKDLDALNELYLSVYDEEQLDEILGLPDFGPSQSQINQWGREGQAQRAAQAAQDRKTRASTQRRDMGVVLRDGKYKAIYTKTPEALSLVNRLNKEEGRDKPAPNPTGSGSTPPQRPSGSSSTPPPRPAASSTVLAKQKGVEGRLDKATGKFTTGAFSSAEKSRYSSVAAKNAASSGAPKPATEKSPQGYSVGTTAGGTKFERRTPTRQEMDVAKRAGGGEAGVKAAVTSNQPTTGPANATIDKSSVEASKAAFKPAPTPARNGFGASTAGANAAASVSSATAPALPGQNSINNNTIKTSKTPVNQENSYEWPSAKTIRDIAGAYSSIYEAKKKVDQDEDGDNDFGDVRIARMIASGVPKAKAIAMVKNKSYNEEIEIDEATAMAKRGYDETEIRNKIAKNTKGGEAADRATELENRPTFGDRAKQASREKLARTQRGDFRRTTSSDYGLRLGAHKSDDPTVKAKQKARGAQRSALTPREKKQLNREAYEAYEFVASYLLENNFATTVDDANVIINNMSEGWFESIMEDVGGNQYTPNPIGNAIKAGAGLAKKVLSNPTVSGTINKTLRGNTSSGGYSTKPGDGKPYKDGPLWDGGGPKTSPKPQTKKQPPMRDEPLW